MGGSDQIIEHVIYLWIIKTNSSRMLSGSIFFNNRTLRLLPNASFSSQKLYFGNRAGINLHDITETEFSALEQVIEVQSSVFFLLPCSFF